MNVKIVIMYLTMKYSLNFTGNISVKDNCNNVNSNKNFGTFKKKNHEKKGIKEELFITYMKSMLLIKFQKKITISLIKNEYLQ